MPKRHHHSKHHGMHGSYEGHESRRHQEVKDSYMIKEDHSAIANMPQQVMIKPWPAGYSYLPEDLDDSIHGIDRQLGMDDGQTRRHNVPKKV